MRVLIDGDAFPNLLKPVIFKAITKRALQTIVVSNKKISIGESECIEYVLVKQGLDEADHLIVELIAPHDLVITADIPLADRAVSKEAIALNHRGELYTKENIKQYLAMRNLMEEIRSTGEILSGPAPFGKKDVEAFANGLYKYLDSVLKN